MITLQKKSTACVVTKEDSVRAEDNREGEKERGEKIAPDTLFDTPNRKRV